jgi:short-subunit dehydrogenase
MKIEGKVFVVTGGGNGIGREVTLLLLKKGAKVAAVDMNETALNETLTLSGDLKQNISLHVVNIIDRIAVESLVGEVEKAHGPVDGLLNIAGIIQKFVRVIDLDYMEIEKVMNVNFFGPVNMTKSFLPGLLKRPEAHILNVSSMGSFVPVPGQTIYGASKAAVKLFTEGLNSELSGTKVRVTVVFPGAIATNIASNSGVSMGNVDASSSKIKMTLPTVAAQKIVEAVQKSSYRVFIGSDSKLMDFMFRLNPKSAAEMINKQMASLLK